MKKIRINELARECEQPNSEILAILPKFGVTEKKTHSSSVDEDVADLVRRHFGVFVERPAGSAPAEDEGGAASVAESTPQTARVEPHRAEAREAREDDEEPAQQPAQEEPRTIEPQMISALTPEERLSARPAAHPIRPPLLGRQRPVQPPQPAAEPAQPAAATPAPPMPQTPPPPAEAKPAAELPAATPPPVPTAPARPAPPSHAVAPGHPARPARPAPGSMPARPLPPSGPRPGQIISGPRQPLPAAAEPGRPSRPAPSAPRPVPTPPPAQSPVPPNAVVTGRPLAGQPAARPVVPPRPDLVARLAQTKAAMPGQPQPRPAMPGRPQAAPVPGQPIYKGPIRPGQPLMRQRPGAPGPAGRGRGMHPTTPLRPEPATPPPTDQRRGQKPRTAHVIDREREEGKLFRPTARSRAEEFAKLAEGKQITIAEGITVKELSEKLGIKANLVIKRLVDRKIFATINQTLDAKLASELARDFGAVTSQVSFEEEATQQLESAEVEEDLVKRAPVVTIMGHVDHGKTSLLDAIRASNVAEREAGGITQHIGAYTVEQDGRKIVFIDTPGHEAFTRMRARGATVTDIVVLVVAADDGVMPQTVESIAHARAAEVPIIVAINKIDKADAQPERVKQQLSDRGLVPEDWGGETVMVPVSARNKQHIDVLLEMILLVADMEDLKANPDRPGVATVLEAKLDRGRGPVATVLVRNGTLRIGDFFLSGSVFGKVRAMFDDHGQPVREVGPSTPVEVLGLDSLPDVGDSMQVVTDTAKAKQIVIYRESKAREQALAKSARVTLDQLHEQIKAGDVKELRIILKADVGGSAEVLSETLQKLSTDKVKVQVIHSGVGAITETDVLLASASNAIVVGFNVRPDRNATTLAEHEKVDIRLHTIIYDLTDEIKRAMTGMLEPVFKEVYRGRAEVRETFRISKVGTIAGCLVVDGTVPRDGQVRILRDNVVVFTGKISSLKRFKDDASEVRSGLECGISIENFNDLKPRDVIEAFVTERVATEALV